MKAGSSILALAAVLACIFTIADGLVRAASKSATHVATSVSRQAGRFNLHQRLLSLQAATVDDDHGNKTPTATDLKAAQIEANNLRLMCARWVLVSGILNAALEGKNILACPSDSWAIGLNTLWRFSFAYSLWQVTSVYAKLYHEKDVANVEQEIETVFRTMTAVWRQTGVVVILLILEETTKTLQDKIPFVNEILLSLVGVAIASTIFLSGKETALLSLSECSAAESDETSKDRLIRHGRVTLRAMSLCSVAFLINALFLGFIAVSQDSWGRKAVTLTDLPTRLGLGTLLWELRKAFGKGLKVLTHKSNKNFIMTPKTGMELQEATVKFWTKAKGTIELQVVVTAGAAIVRLVKGQLGT